MRKKIICYQAARSLPSVKFKNVWQALCLCSIGVFRGAPDVVAQDSEEKVLEKSFQEIADLFSVFIKSIPLEPKKPTRTV